MTRDYSPEEERELREALATPPPHFCPRCGSRLVFTPIRPNPGVSYVRSRVLLQCPGCGRRAALDRDSNS